MAMRIWLVLVAAMGVAHADTHFDPFTSMHGRPPEPAKKVGYSGLGAESLSPEVIAKFAAPPLDPAVSRRIQAMLDVRGVGGGIVGNRGDRQYFSWRVTGTAQVWRQDGPMKFPVQLTGGEDRTSVVGMAPDEKWLVVSRDIGGSEDPGLYIMQPGGGPLRVVIHAPKVQTELAYVTEDSSALYYGANDLDPASYAIYRWDLGDGQRTLVFDTPGLWHVVDHVGDRWLMEKELGNTQVEVYEYDLATKKLTPLLGQGEAEELYARYGAKPGQVLVRTNKLGEFYQLYTLEAGKLVAIGKPSPHDVEDFTIDEARARIYYTENVDGYLRLHVLDAKTLRPIELPKLPESDNQSLGGISRNGRFVQITLDGARLAPTTVVWDWTTKKLETWRVPATPEIDVSTFAPVALESYPARDGTKIPMFVRRPSKCEEPCPVVVMLHGGPESQARPGFDSYSQMFVDAGFVFVEPNVRGSSGYGKAWLHADDGPKRLGVITDIEDVSRYIRSAWAKDGKPPRIGVIGGSYGGYSALMAMTYFAGAFDAGVAEYSISNLSTFLLNTAPYRRILRISEYGDPVKDKDVLEQLSPITHVAKLKEPLLLVQGVNDPRTPVGEALQIHDELEQRGVPGGLILFPDEGHGAVKRSNIVLQIGHAIAFFERHLR